jgi:hypothetical protein
MLPVSGPVGPRGEGEIAPEPGTGCAGAQTGMPAASRADHYP